MGRASNVSWPSIFIVTAVSALCLMLVWFIRSIVRLTDHANTTDDMPVWSIDWYDGLAGIGVFIFVVVVGVMISCRGHQNTILVSSDPIKLSSSHDSHITPVQSYTPPASPVVVFLTPPALQKPLPYAGYFKNAFAPVDANTQPANPYSP
jgi:hypothetical protein